MKRIAGIAVLPHAWELLALVCCALSTTNAPGAPNLEITPVAAPVNAGVSLSEALDTDASFAWGSIGNIFFPWSGRTAISHDGVDAAESGAVADDEAVTLQGKAFGPGLLSWWWKVSSETNKDFLKVFVDGVQQIRISGEVDWQPRSLQLAPGPHILKWTYSKNESGSVGQDKGWLDEVRFAPDTNCVFHLSSAGRLHDFGAGTATVSVATSPDCPWFVHCANDWMVALSPIANRGSGVVTYALTKNPTTSPRTGFLVIADQTFAVTQAAGLTNEELHSAQELLDVRSNPYEFLGGSSRERGLVTHDGVDAAQLGPIPHNSTASIHARLVGPGTVSFWWKVSSETNLDFLKFFGPEGEVRLSGEVDWQFRSYHLPPGYQEVIWVYFKDETISMGNDRGWVDQLQFVPETNCPVVISPASRRHGSCAQYGFIEVTHLTNCGWSAWSTSDWITVQFSINNATDARVDYWLLPNATGQERTGYIQFGTETCTIIQSNGICIPDDFNPGMGGNDYPVVYSLALQPDGKIVVGGEFTSLGGRQRKYIGRLNADGELDAGFDPGAEDRVYALALQPDGKILVGGSFATMGRQSRYYIGRLNPDGTLDGSFNPGASRGLFYTYVSSLAVQLDGKILVSGNFTTLAGQPRRYIGRLNADGTLDGTFQPEVSSSVVSLAVQADGKILVSGDFTTLGGQPRRSIGRLNADGTLDSTFNAGDARGEDTYISTMAMQADGKIVVGGGFLTLGGQIRNHIARLHVDGTLDSSFHPGANGSVQSLVVQADGKVLAGGGFDDLGGQRRRSIARLNADGTLDNGFNPGANQVLSIAVQADGKVLVGGSWTFFRTNNTDQAIQSMDREGTTLTWLRGGASPEVWRTTFEHSSNGLDWTFLGSGTRSPGGWQLTGVSPPSNGTVRARGYVAGGYQNASGGIVEGYYGRPVIVSQPASRTNVVATHARFRVVVGGSGPWNVQWLKNGVLWMDQGNAVDAANAATLTLGQVSKADEAGYSAVLSNAFGSVTSVVATLTVLDPFITGHPTGRNWYPGQSVAFTVMALGTPPLSYQWYHDGAPVPGATNFWLTRQDLSRADAGFYTVTVNGTQGSVTSAPALLTVNAAALDSTFNPGASSRVLSIAGQPDGKILMGGAFSDLAGQMRIRIGRLTADGTLDGAFNPGTGGFERSVSSLAVQGDGRILVGGGFTGLAGDYRNYIGRLNADGTLDSTFFNIVVNNEVISLGLQPDGKILLGGYFTAVNGQTRNSIARLNADGTLDSSFNPDAGGIGYNVVHSLALQTDGKILVGGRFRTLGGQPRSCIGRLNANGTLDSTFNPGASNWVYCLAVQADGKILVGGEFDNLGGEPRNFIGRLNGDGTLDASFNPGANNSVYSLALQADGKILVSGNFTTLGGQSRDRIARLNADGTLDGTFNPRANNLVHSLALQADGRILVGGDFTTLDGQPRNRIARLNNTESPTQTLRYEGNTITWLRGGTSPEAWRTTFEYSTNGLVWTYVGAGTRISGGWQMTGVALPPTAALRARGYVAAGYYNASGGIVEGYLGRPLILSQPASRTNVVTTSADFRVMVGGSGPWNVRWFRNGILWVDQGNAVDAANTATLTLSPVSKSDEGAYHAVLSNAAGSVTSVVATLTVLDPFIIGQPAGTNWHPGLSVTLNVVAVGMPPLSYQWYHDGMALPGALGSSLTWQNPTTADAGYYTVTVSGTHGSVTSAPALLTVNAAELDHTFNPGAGGEVLALATQPDEKILVAGAFTDLAGQMRNRMARLNADGTLDSTFMNTSSSPGPSNRVFSMVAQADGKIMVGGEFTGLTSLGGPIRHRMARLNADGTLDSTFNAAVNNLVNCLAVQADGKILAGGFFNTVNGQPRSHITRLDANGTLDSAFNPGAGGSFVTSIALQANGQIVVGGEFFNLGVGGRHNIGRLNSDGTLDTAFNPDASSTVLALAVQADGKIVAGGHFGTLGGQPRNQLARLNADGTLDSTFSPWADNLVYSLAVQADGRILVGGQFTNLGGQPRDRIARLNANGTLDGTFNPGADNLVYSLAVQADGRILAGGEFTNLGGQPRNRIARLNNTAPATQSLGYDGTNITWLRGGTSPEVWRTLFEYSTNGLAWTYLGAGTRISGGWQMTGVALPPSAALRARGYVAAGYYNASGGIVETTLSAPWSSRLQLVRDGSTMVLTWTGGQGPYQVQQTTNLSQPDSWQDVGAPVHTNSITLPLGPTHLFLRIRGL